VDRPDEALYCHKWNGQFKWCIIPYGPARLNIVPLEINQSNKSIIVSFHMVQLIYKYIVPLQMDQPNMPFYLKIPNESAGLGIVQLHMDWPDNIPDR
jgi:hypothetical protein